MTTKEDIRDAQESLGHVMTHLDNYEELRAYYVGRRDELLKRLEVLEGIQRHEGDPKKGLEFDHKSNCESKPKEYCK